MRCLTGGLPGSFRGIHGWLQGCKAFPSPRRNGRHGRARDNRDIARRGRGREEDFMSEVIKLSSPATREFWEMPVLFEDEHLLALDKPAGLLTSPDRYDPARPNLMKLLHAGIERGAPWAKQRGLSYLMNAHRLDFETSGIILLAMSKPDDPAGLKIQPVRVHQI